MAWSHDRKPRKKAASSRPISSSWWLNLSISAVAASTLIFLGHWFSGKEGRRVGGRGRRDLADEDANGDGSNGNMQKRTGSANKPTNLAELHLRRLEAAEARSHRANNGSSAARLTPLGMIIFLTQKVDRLEEEALSLLGNVAGRIMSPLEEKEQLRLLELLAKVQLEVDDAKGDETVRPHRRSQTNRIQSLITKLDLLKPRATYLEANLG